MYRYTITLPVNSNEGVPFEASKLDALRDIVIDLAGGATLHPEAQGYWRNEHGAVVAEPVRVLEAIGDESLGRKLRLTAKLVRDLLKQDCVLFTATPIVSEFI